MFSARKRVISHTKITETMRLLGHIGIQDGVCNGLGQMFIQAALCGEIDIFMERLYFICNEPDLLKKIAAAKSKRGKNLTALDQACIDVLAFLDGVQLYQNFSYFTYLFKNKPHHLDAASISKLTLPLKLEKNPIVEIFSENRFFNISSMQHYLNELAVKFEDYAKRKEILEKSGFQIPELLIALHSGSHKTVLRYKNQIACWELTDANQYPHVLFPCAAGSVLVLDSLVEGFLVPVNISIFTSAENLLKNIAQKNLEKIKTPQFFSSEAACALSLKNHGLLSLTAMRGDVDNFSKLTDVMPELQLRKEIPSAAYKALHYGQTAILNIIFARFSNWILSPDNASTFLEKVITNSQNEFIGLMARKGADIDALFDGQRPLHIAIAMDNLEAVIELITLGADTSLANDKGETPLMYAIRLHQIDIVCYLVRLAKIELTESNINGDTLLITAVRENSPSACEILLKQSINPDAQNNKGETAALVAAELNYSECLALLISHQADLTIADYISRTPFFMAMVKQNWETAAFILLNLKTLKSFNPFSYQLAVNYLEEIIQCATDQIEKMKDEDRKKCLSDISHHRNALGMMLSKKPNIEFASFFKIKEKKRQAYLRTIKSGCKTLDPAPLFDTAQKSAPPQGARDDTLETTQGQKRLGYVRL